MSHLASSLSFALSTAALCFLVYGITDDKPPVAAARPAVIMPGDALYIEIVPKIPDEKEREVYRVEPSGKIALGPRWGRIDVGGKTIEEAELLIKERAKSVFEDPRVCVTWLENPIASRTSVLDRLDRLEREVALLREQLGQR